MLEQRGLWQISEYVLLAIRKVARTSKIQNDLQHCRSLLVRLPILKLNARQIDRRLAFGKRLGATMYI